LRRRSRQTNCITSRHRTEVAQAKPPKQLHHIAALPQPIAQAKPPRQPLQIPALPQPIAQAKPPRQPLQIPAFPQPNAQAKPPRQPLQIPALPQPTDMSLASEHFFARNKGAVQTTAISHISRTKYVCLFYRALK
jgi:hypothetical protein